MLAELHNLEQRQIIADQLRTAIYSFKSGTMGAIETARALVRFRNRDKALDTLLAPFVAVDSETDALPIGDVRTLWNAAALVSENGKIKAAQKWANPIVAEACNQIEAKLREVGL